MGRGPLREKEERKIPRELSQLLGSANQFIRAWLALGTETRREVFKSVSLLPFLLLPFPPFFILTQVHAMFQAGLKLGTVLLPQCQEG